MYFSTETGFEWGDPDAEAYCHLEVSVCEAAGRRFVPGVDMSVWQTTDDGDEIGPVELPVVRHPDLHNYGRNIPVPADGTDTLHVHVAPPSFPHHDEENGDRFDDSVDVTFNDVSVVTQRE